MGMFRGGTASGFFPEEMEMQIWCRFGGILCYFENIKNIQVLQMETLAGSIGRRTGRSRETTEETGGVS
jgi:hypothetical protein